MNVMMLLSGDVDDPRRAAREIYTNESALMDRERDLFFSPRAGSLISLPLSKK
jgi:hypothetical protein